VGVSGTGHSKNGRTAKFGRISGFFELKWSDCKLAQAEPPKSTLKAVRTN
jgi:hypothetical protein